MIFGNILLAVLTSITKEIQTGKEEVKAYIKTCRKKLKNLTSIKFLSTILIEEHGFNLIIGINNNKKDFS